MHTYLHAVNSQPSARKIFLHSASTTKKDTTSIIKKPNLADNTQLLKHQTALTDFYPEASYQERYAEVKSEFWKLQRNIKLRKARNKHVRRKYSRQEVTLGLHSQNVVGFKKENKVMEGWFNHFRQQDQFGAYNIIFLQETHMVTSEIGHMQQQHMRHWGFEYKVSSDSSFWSGGHDRKGGVAILLSPYSTIRTMIPVLPNPWN